eukprot:355550-Chlamydomonas_euryale.AAC.3
MDGPKEKEGRFRFKVQGLGKKRRGCSVRGKYKVRMSCRGPAARHDLARDLARDLACHLACELACGLACDLALDLACHLACNLACDLACDLALAIV